MQQLGRYELQEELGRGAMGAVYRGRDPVIDRVVAVKTIRLDRFTPGEEEGYKKRFFREAQAAGRLSHPGIVTVHDVGVDASVQTPYIVMEYVEGRTLENLLDDPAVPLNLDQRLEILQQVAEALDYAHAQGIVHRDIKPANILVTSNGVAKVTDFGVARMRQTQATTSEFVGTPSYMSPEQVRGQRVDGRADLFGLGVILYRALTNELPFTGDLAELVNQIATDDPVPVTKRNPSLSVAYDRVIELALAKDAEDRYQHGRELADHIEDLRAGRSLRIISREKIQPQETVQLADKTVQLYASGTSATPAPGTMQRRRVVRQRVTDYPPGAWGKFLAASDRVLDFMQWMENKVVAWNRRVRPIPRLWAWTKARTAQFIAWNARVRPVPRAWAWYRAQKSWVQGVLALFVVLLVGLAVYQIGFRPRAYINVDVEHNMRSGNVSIWVDDHFVVENALEGEAAGRRGSLRLYKGSYTVRIRMDAGEHGLRVRCSAPELSYDEIRDVRGTFVRDEERALSAVCDARNRTLLLTLR
jgi:hypothetical protein